MTSGVLGLDVAWARPTTAQIVATGAHFVARYLSPDSSKNLTSAEVQEYPANGLSIVVVWESTAGRMLSGSAAGIADAQAAESQRRALGLPEDMVIYFACDTDVSGTQFHTINDYLRGVNSVIGLSRTGLYGGYYEVENVAASPASASYFWQTTAWSNGHWSDHANIRQDGGTLLGGSADSDYAETADFGQYPRPNGDDMPSVDDIVQGILNAKLGSQYALPYLDGYIPTVADALHGACNAEHGVSTTDYGASVWNYALPDQGPDGKPLGTSKSAFWFLVWNDVHYAELLAAIQKAAVDAKMTPADLASALADGTLKVDITVSTPAPTTPKAV